MKRIIALLFVIVSLVSHLAGCGSTVPDEYTSLIADSANDEFGVKSESDFWEGGYFTKEGMNDKTCVVYGKSYTGSYSRSIVEKMNSYTTDIYKAENNIEFGLRDDTGELSYINVMNSEFFDIEPYLEDVENPYEGAVSLAAYIAGSYININDYVQIVEDPIARYKERDGVTHQITYYIVTYAKKVNGYFSSDYISVKVTSKGNLASIKMGDINAFSDTEIVFDESKMNQSISDKIDSTYKNSKLKVEKINIKDQKIVLTPDGDISMFSEITIDGINDSNDNVQTGIRIITVLGSKRK